MPTPRTIAACRTALLATGVVAGAGVAMPGAAHAQRIENQVAVFAALDKVTAHISRLEIKLGDTAKFGALKIKPLRCYSRPPDLQPKTTTFVEVRETQLDSSEKKIFSGWMFAEDPGLNAVEHPVYDVWLTECAAPKTVASRAPVAQPASAASGGRSPATGGPVPPLPPAQIPADDSFPRRRPPR